MTYRCGRRNLGCHLIVAVLSLSLAPYGFTAQPSQLTADQAKVLESARAAALQYALQLPDFICDQITRREVIDQKNVRDVGFGPNTRPADVGTPTTLSKDYIEEQLAFVGGKESYSHLMVNGKAASDTDRMLLVGAITSGEFGTLFSEIFTPSSRAAFSWDREARAHGRRVWVFKYRVPKEAGTTVMHRPTNTTLIVSNSGKVSIDPETSEILEITSVPELPRNFPLSDIECRIVYTAQDIAGKRYILPAHSETHMKEGGQIYENKIDFKNYHHFGSESTIHYEGSGSS